MSSVLFDKYKKEIRNGSVLCFENGSIYEVVKKKDDLYLKCKTKKLPLFKLEKIAIDGILVSGYMNSMVEIVEKK